MSNFEIKKRKVSKKTKNSWRKHVDVKDVDAFLENQRLEERLGVPISTKKNQELFILDKGGKDNIDDKNWLAKKQRRELLRNSEPQCFKILTSFTEIPIPIVKKNHVKSSKERKSALVKKKETLNKISRNLKLKKNLVLKNKELVAVKSSETSVCNGFNFDIWKQEPIINLELKNEWFNKDIIRHTYANTGKKIIRVPKSLHEKTSLMAAITVPHPGTSYNPSYSDHQKLLKEVESDEQKLIKEEKHLNRVTSKMFRKVTQVQKNNENLQEMSEGLSFSFDEESENEDSDAIVKSINPPVQNKKKTLTQRRKIKELQKLKEEKLKKKIEKKKIADIYHLGQIGNQIRKKLEKQEIIKEKKIKHKVNMILEPKTLSRHKFKPMEQEFLTGKELSGNLRNTKPACNLLKDRYKSLQQRNIIAPGIMSLKKNKAKVKKFIKADHKIDLAEVKE